MGILGAVSPAVGAGRKANATCGRRVVTRRLVYGHIASTHSTARILRCLLRQMHIERVDAAGKVIAVVIGSKQFEPERRAHIASAIRRLRALSARFIDDAIGGES